MISTPVKLSPPWITLFNQIKSLFEQDPEIKIEYINDPPTVKLFVENEKKAEALAALLPYQINVGFTLKIIVIPANTTLFGGQITFNKENQYKNDAYSLDYLFNTAFEGNPAFWQVVTIEGLFNNRFTFVEFEPKVVQFYNDNLGDLHGNLTTLYEIIARDIFGENSNLKDIFYCTAVVPKEGN